MPGMLDHGGLLGLRLGDEFIADRLQHIGVDADARYSIFASTRTSGTSSSSEERPCVACLAERRHEVVHGERCKARLLGGIRRGAAVEIELSFGWATRELRRSVGTGAPSRRCRPIEQVGEAGRPQSRTSTPWS